MFAVMPNPSPVFATANASSPYRPSVSSPLSSSPIRASSSSPPRRGTQSSPIQPPPPPGGKLFKYAARNPRSNPLLARRREDVQEGRRRLFLNHVRKRADDQRWERRGGENELLKLEWWRQDREWRLAKAAELAAVDPSVLLDEEVVDSDPSTMMRDQPDESTRLESAADEDLDNRMVDAIEQQEQAELDALISSLPSATADADMAPVRPDSPHFSDDDDYDTLFADYLSRERGSNDVDMDLSHSQDVDVEMS